MSEPELSESTSSMFIDGVWKTCKTALLYQKVGCLSNDKVVAWKLVPAEDQSILYASHDSPHILEVYDHFTLHEKPAAYEIKEKAA